MINELGWNTALQEEWNTIALTEWTAGRVITLSHELFKVMTNNGEWIGSLPGSYNYDATFDYPAVGDWVAIEQLPGESRGLIRHVMKRRSQFVRHGAGLETKAQVVASNIDFAFLVMSCNDDFNIRRLERYLVSSWDSGAQPVVVLTKSDLIDEQMRLNMELKVNEAAFGVPLIFVSNQTGEGISDLQELVQPNFTAALLGSSGVGKSTLVNSLLNADKMKTNTIREDDSKGKHTTTHRELIVLPSGGIVVDTPGMRELHLWSRDESDGVSKSFSDIESLFSSCKFNDCRHQTEPGCAVKAALEEGTLSQPRYNSYLKLQRELAYVKKKEVEKAHILEKKKTQTIYTRRNRN